MALMDTMRAQAESFGAQFLPDTIVRTDFTRRPFLCVGEEASYTAEAVIIATGASARWLGVPGEERLRGCGVSACATCDGAFFRGKTVAVAGGGNAAVDEALFLSRLAAHVYLIHKRDTLRAEAIQKERLLACPNVTCLWHKRVTMCQGDKRLEAVTLEDTQTGTSELLPLEGLFVAIGRTPETEVFQQQILLTEKGSIVITSGQTGTSVPGIFAAGDVCAHAHKQAVVAAGSGCQAALEAEQWLGRNPLREA
jgi:thioredoxin reductase (NADPH)